MIPRKKIQALLCVLSVFYLSGKAGQALAYQSRNSPDNYLGVTDTLKFETVVDNAKSTQDDASVSDSNSPDDSTATTESNSELTTAIDSSNSTQDDTRSIDSNTPDDYLLTASTTPYSKLSRTVDNSNSTQAAGGVSDDSNSSDDYNSTTASYTTFSRVVDYSNSTQDAASVSDGDWLDDYNSTIVEDEYTFDNDTTNTLNETTTVSSSCQFTPSSVQNLTVSSTSDSLYLTWDYEADDQECILAYNVTWYSDSDNAGSNSTNPSESTLTISGLPSCTYFTISVVAVGEYGFSEAEIISSNTNESAMSNVKHLAALSIENGLNVTWDAPDDLSCFKNYRLDLMTEANVTEILMTISTTFTSHEFDNLPACAKYTIVVTPISINDNPGLNATTDGETAASVPGPVINLTAPSDEITKDSVYLTWSVPTVNPTCVLYYNIDICYKDNCTRVKTSDEFYTVKDLSPCLSYTFTVFAVGDAGSSDATSTDAETSYVVPEEPSSIEITGGNFSLDISWEPPLVGATCTTAYRLILWGTAVTNTTTDTNITIYDLFACKTYTVQITPISTLSWDGKFRLSNGTTGASVTAPPQLAVEEPEVTESTITISWNVSRTNNECELKTIMTVCNFNSTEGYGIEAINGKSADDISHLDSSTDTIVNVTVGNLSSFSLYECFARTENIAGFSEPSDSKFVRTAEDVPSAPTILGSNSTSTSFTLNWDVPEYLPGQLIAHQISLAWERRYLMPSFCNNDNSSETNIPFIAGSAREYFFANATAYSHYTARIRAQTNAGWGNYSDYFSFETYPGIPGPTSNIEYLTKSSIEDSDILDTLLVWKLPCALNGVIESFYIHFHGTRNREGFANHTFSEVDNVTNITNADYEFRMNLGELKAEYNYTFQISAKVIGVSEYGPTTSYNVIYPAGIPPWPEESYMNKLKLNEYKAERSSSTATLLLPVFKDTNGDIRYYAVMVSEYGQSTPEQSRFDILAGKWPNTSTWREAMSHPAVTTYQATPIQWSPSKPGDIGDFGGVEAVRITLGEDSSCAEATSNSFCNGPLQPETKYQIRMRAFTNGGYRDSMVFIVKTKAEFNLGMVIGVVFGILFFGIILTMTLLIRKGVLQTIRSNLLNHGVHNSPGPKPLTRKNFSFYCQELVENPRKLSSEFQLLQTLSVDLEMSATAAGLQANRKKNRYINILPYDISRVKLDVLNNDPNTDYINASFMPGYSGISEYIACQGPKEETTYDFWRMIFQYNIKVIVMVTQLVEKGKDKCHQYYPNQRENFEYEDIMIRCSTQLDFSSYTKRIITLQKGKDRRTVTHLHFKEWSDHGVPDDVHLMINFCQLVRKQMIDNKSLAVVHCSAGVGRTGTLIAVDILLQQIKDNKKLDVFGTVYKLRQHRMNMVQTESQYAYIYNCTLEALNNPYPPKPYKPPSGEPIYENLKRKKRELTDSNTNLVNSAETLKKISPSQSIDSMEPVCEIIVPQRPIYATQLSTLSQGGLRYSKSTSAINTLIYPNPELVRHGSHEYPIFEPAPDSPSSRRSRDRNSLLAEFARPIIIETGMSRPKSLNPNEKTDYFTAFN